MIDNSKVSNIPCRLHNVGEGGVAGADEIIDDLKGKTQQQINADVDQILGAGGSVDERIAAAVNVEKNRAEGAEAALEESLDNRISSAVSAEATRAQAAEADRYTKSETYTKEEVHNLITTPNQEFISVVATDQTTAATDVLPATGEADTIYRVGNWDGTQYNDSVFSEYAWNGSAYVKLSTKSQVGEVYDISANHAGATYDDLSAALGTNGANIPQSLRKGGMSVKFVQSSDNKYVQFRLMATSFSTTESDWQGVDENPTAGSKNFVESGGVAESIYNIKGYDLISTYQTAINTQWPIIHSISLPTGSYKFEFQLPLQAGVTTDIYLRKGDNEPYLVLDKNIPLDGNLHSYVIDTTEIVTRITFGSFSGSPIDYGTITTNIYSVFVKRDLQEIETYLNETSARTNNMCQVDNYTQSENELEICDEEFRVGAKLKDGYIKTKNFDPECYECIEDGFFIVDTNFKILVSSYNIVRSV